MAIGGAIVLSATAVAGTATWTGGADPTANWSEAGNWSSAPLTGDDLVFSGSAGLLNTNDLSTANGGSLLVNSITFDATAGEAFDISGTPILFTGKTITNNSLFRQSLNLRLQETGTGMIAAGSGDLYLAGLETNSFSHVYTKNGSGLVEVDGTYSTVDGSPGAPFQLTVNGGTLDWAGGIFGTVNINTGATLISSNANWHYNTTCKLNSSTSTLGFTINTGLGELDAVAGSVIKSMASGGTTVVDFNQDATRVNDIAGNLVDGDSGGRLGILLGSNTGSPLVNLSGQNTYTGNTELRTAGSVLNLLNGGKLSFKIEEGGVSNRIFGPGLPTLDGAFAIDLSAAGTPVSGNKWTLVQSPRATYGTNFAVTDFTEIQPGVWKRVVGPDSWYFTEVSGKLGFGVLPESVWKGEGGGNWSAAGSWTSGAAPVSGDLPTFTGANVSNSNDLATGWDTVNNTTGAVVLEGLRFDAAATSFNLAGNEIYLDGKTIENLSANPQTISAGIAAGTAGLSVATAAGNLTLSGALNNYAAANRALNKTGSGTLVLNGTQNESWALNVNAGTMQVFNPNNGTKTIGSGGNVAAGATLRTETDDAISANGIVAVSGTFDMAGSGEALGAVTGSGVVTNHGAGGGTALLSFQRNNTIWDGVIRNGGNTTAVAFTGTTTGSDSVTFNGANIYTGNTTVGANASFTLSNTGSLLFAPGANGVSGKVTGDQTAGTGFVKLDGKLKLNLTGANATNGNAWTLVDTSTLTETYGSTFAVSDTAVVQPVGYKINGGNNTVGSFAASTGYVTPTPTHFATGSTIDVTAVTDPAPQGVYQTEYYTTGTMTYTFTGLEAGNNYRIRLHFAELYQTAVNKRKFDVLINGALVLDDYDIFAVTGARYKAVVEERTVPANSSGVITIAFAKGPVDNAKINGIEIIDNRPASTFSDFTKSGNVWTRVDGSKTWTFSETTGVLSLAVGGGGPNYSTWATANGIPGQPASGDYDHDGLSNLMEYALGKSPTTSSVPAGSFTAGTVSFTKGAEAVANGDVTWAIQESDDLGITDPWSVVTPTVNNATTISYTLPNGKRKLFTRLRVEQK